MSPIRTRARAHGADLSAIGRTLVVGEPTYRTRPDSSEGRVLVYQLPASP